MHNLRNKKYRLLWKGFSQLNPTDDVLTRWSSLYLMIERFLSYRGIITAHPEVFVDFKIDNITWTRIENTLRILTPIYSLTLNIQKSDLTIPDFFFVVGLLVYLF